VQGFRYFNVYGNLEDHKKDQASPVTKFRQQSKTGSIKLFKDSDKYLRDFVAVEDVCRTHLKFVHVKESGLWNVGTGNPASFEHVARLISARYNAQIEYIEMPEILKKGYQAYTCANLTKLEETIGPQQWLTVEDWLNTV
jgi:ADP-L-glycero-D-manno-heptose 6-epimerase